MARGRLTEDSISLASSPPKAAVPAAAYDGTPKEHTGRITKMAFVDNLIGKKVAWAIG